MPLRSASLTDMDLFNIHIIREITRSHASSIFEVGLDAQKYVLKLFHNNGDPKVYGGSADMMVRSFDRRIEALFLIVNDFIKKQAMKILLYNLKDNQNTYVMREDGAYIKKREPEEQAFNIHREFYNLKVTPDEEISLF